MRWKKVVVKTVQWVRASRAVVLRTPGSAPLPEGLRPEASLLEGPLPEGQRPEASTSLPGQPARRELRSRTRP